MNLEIKPNMANERVMWKSCTKSWMESQYPLEKGKNPNLNKMMMVMMIIK